MRREPFHRPRGRRGARARSTRPTSLRIAVDRRRPGRASRRGDGGRPRPRRHGVRARERPGGTPARARLAPDARELVPRGGRSRRSIDRHGGRLETGAAIESRTLLALPADTFVVATGATWDETGASARRPERTGSPESRRAGPRPGRRARPAPGAIRAVRTAGRHPGRDRHLRAAGARRGARHCGRQTSTSSHPPRPSARRPAAELELPHVMPRLRRLGVELTVWHDIGRSKVAASYWMTSGEERPPSIEEVDAIVLAIRRVPRDALFGGLGCRRRDREAGRRCTVPPHDARGHPRGGSARTGALARSGRRGGLRNGGGAPPTTATDRPGWRGRMRIWWQSFVDPAQNEPYLDLPGRLPERDRRSRDDRRCPRHGTRRPLLRESHGAQVCGAGRRQCARGARQGYDAFVMGHFQDSGLYEARSALAIPVVGLGETSLHWAAQIGRNIGARHDRPGVRAVAPASRPTSTASPAASPTSSGSASSSRTSSPHSPATSRRSRECSSSSATSSSRWSTPVPTSSSPPGAPGVGAAAGARTDRRACSRRQRRGGHPQGRRGMVHVVTLTGLEPSRGPTSQSPLPGRRRLPRPA